MDNYTKQYHYEIDLCYRILQCCNNNKNITSLELNKILLQLFSIDVINQARRKFLGEK